MAGIRGLDGAVMMSNFGRAGNFPESIEFGTSGWRSKIGEGFTAEGVKAVSQAVANLQKVNGESEPIIVGGDTRYASPESVEIATRVFVANHLPVYMCRQPIPTPAMSRAVQVFHLGGALNATSSHNPKDYNGLKFTPSHGGPAEKDISSWISMDANRLLAGKNKGVRMIDPSIPLEDILKDPRNNVVVFDNVASELYAQEMSKVIEFGIIRDERIKVGIEPFGGSVIKYAQKVFERFRIKHGFTSTEVDPSFSFVRPDDDGEVRMDPTKARPMAHAIRMSKSEGYDIVAGIDPDADRAVIVDRGGTLVSPNIFYTVAFWYLMNTRSFGNVGLARSVATTHMADRIAARHNIPVYETDVGFKNFVPLLQQNMVSMAIEESGGAVPYGWTTDKDGLVMALLAAEIIAVSGKSIMANFQDIKSQYGKGAISTFTRVDQKVTPAVQRKLKNYPKHEYLPISSIGFATLGGQPITRIRTLDGIKIYTPDAWVLFRLSGTEPLVRIYGESFKGKTHLEQILKEGKRFLAKIAGAR